MKKLLLFVAVATFGFANAQIEAKINPLGAMFGNPRISGEYVVSDSFGVELAAGAYFGQAYVGLIKVPNAKQSGFGVRAVAKYYFSPDDGGDGWYGGIYLRQNNKKYTSKINLSDNYKGNIFAVGIEFGKKWVFDSGFLIESGFALGRPISEKRTGYTGEDDYEIGVDGYAKFVIGYRFM